MPHLRISTLQQIFAGFRNAERMLKVLSEYRLEYAASKALDFSPWLSGRWGSF
jgi:hypothetical protein